MHAQLFFIAFQSPSLSSLQLVDFSGETTDIEKQRRKRHQRKTQEMHSFVLRESPWRIFAFRIQLLAQERNDPYEHIDASKSSETSLVTNFIRNEEIES